MKHDYAINANFNIGDISTNNTLKLNGKDIAGGGKEYTAGAGIDISTDDVISIKDGGITVDKIAEDVLNFLIPTGTIVPYVGNEAPDGWMMCNGEILENNDTTAKLWNLLYQNPNFCTGNDVYLPDLKGRFIKGVSGGDESPGVTEDSALPNIKAEWPILYYYGHPQYVKSQEIHDKYYSGAVDNFKEFPEYTTQPILPGCGDTGGAHGYGWKAEFDASKSNEIYKNGVNEVTPPNMSLNYIIKL